MGTWLALFPSIVLLTALYCSKPGLCKAQSCLSQPLVDMTLAVNEDVLRSVRGTDPLIVSSPEECASQCCTEHSIAGDRRCNLYIFDNRKFNKHPNCYLFHCPTVNQCPMKRTKGVISYRILPENEDTWASSPNKQVSGGSNRSNKLSSSKPSEGSMELDISKSSQSSRNGESASVHSHGDVEDSQYLEGKKFGSSVNSKDAGKISDNSEDPQDSEANKSSPSVNSQGHKEDVHSQDAGKISDNSEDPQDSESNKSSPSVNSQGHLSKIPEDKKQPQNSAKGSEMQIQVGSLVKDSASQNRITSQMIDLAKDIEKQLDIMESEPAKHPSLSDISPSDTLESVHKLESSAKESNPASGKIPVTLHTFTRLQWKLPTAAPDIVKPSTSTFSLLYHTQANNQGPNNSQNKLDVIEAQSVGIGSDNAVSSSRYNLNVPMESSTAKAPMSENLVTRKKLLDIDHETKFPSLNTTFLSVALPTEGPKVMEPNPELPSNKTEKVTNTMTFSLASTKSTLPEDLKLSPSSAHNDVQNNEVRKLETPEMSGNSHMDERNGLVAALVFGVIFLLVVIGLIGRKISEARRRNQYNKLDYLINGMYVDT
ncbi:hypothetical protein GDO86_005059 [Hymenochirus boettgeri]|uniref:MANSC domain-containing protein n=1 Tax=Hymenochirus boettgeri TaxID=247094 RepID=A0A8T2J5U5_9PIPI|nr:hypothetical protein GDO86_005059 [Hymenochirus boettgeri]KAG8438719.1 hypothetical protein GDO86_005059 [Hymenochirus boettgeri]